MEDLSKLCFFCMQPVNENGICERCHDVEFNLQEAPFLAAGTVIGGRYYIGAMRQSNGESALYIAYDTKLSRPCMVREFFPETLASRHDDGITVMPMAGCENSFNDCMENFQKLWTKLYRLKGLTALISVYEVLRLNNTVYAVYADTDEVTLRAWLLANGTGYISWEQARILFMPVLSTLVTLHTSGVIHRGISPSSFIVTADEKLKLTDFCIADVRSAYGELTPDISDGYAPPEIYRDEGDVGPWTDIYAFTAVLFRSLIGSTPIPALVRLQNDQMMIPAKFAEQLPPYVINAIINGMQLNPDDRTRNAEQLRSNLSASPRAISASAGVRTAKVPSNETPVKTATAEPAAEVPAVTPPVRRRVPQPEQLVENKAAALQTIEREKKRKTLIYILIVILVLLTAGIILVGSELYKTLDTRSSNVTETTTVLQDIQVPDFTTLGLTYTQIVTNEYYAANFEFKKVDMNSDTVAAGAIISQDIAPGTTVKVKTCILLTVSAGKKSYQVPDLTGKTYEEALQLLASQGINCTKHSKYNDGTHTADTVAETVPPAGSTVSAGDTVSIVLWSSLSETTTAASLNNLPGINETTTALQPDVPSTLN